MMVQVILSQDGKVFASEDFKSEAAAVQWAESHRSMNHYHVTLYKNADDDPYAEYIVSSRNGMNL